MPKGAKRPTNCFKCWHCLRVEGRASYCICVVNETKSNPPELIMKPYSGECKSFYDKSTQEFIYESDDSEEVRKKRGPEE